MTAPEPQTPDNPAPEDMGFLRSERSARIARARWLPEGRRGPMPWIIGIMMFLTLLAAAAGLMLAHALTQMHGDLANGYTVQIIEANAEARSFQVRRVAQVLRSDKSVQSLTIVPEKELLKQLQPWIGADTPPGELPVPALIDLQLSSDTPPAKMTAITNTITSIAPSARIDAHEHYLGPVEQLMRTLMWLAAGLASLMIFVTAAVVMLAARSAYATHRTTIDVMHHLGATDVQVARLFQRRIALDAAFGGVLGMITAAATLWLIDRRIIATDSQLTGMASSLPWYLMVLLPLIPALGVGLAMITARITVRRALGRIL